MNNKIKSFLFFLIIGIALVLRLSGLGSVPISPDWDEAALGYNAYSILQTGKDEYGEFLPLVLRSFDDYKPALYAYLIIPFIKIFGLEVYAVRLPSAIFGVITVAAAYFLTKELLRFGKKDIKKSQVIEIISLVSSLVLAVSPWHIQFSRIAFEANVAISLNTCALLFFFKGLRNGIFLSLSTIFAALSIYTYQSEKVFLPLLFLSMILIFRKVINSVKKTPLIFAVMVGFLVILPMFIVLITDKQSLSRAQGVSILTEKTPLLEKNVQKLIRHKENNDILGLIFDNRRVVYLKTVLWGYLSHFDPNWLFIKGDFDVDRHHAPNMGLLYLLDIPFFLIGIYLLFFNTKLIDIHGGVRVFLISWFLIAPIPASVTTGLPHAVRTLNFLPAIQIVIAIGLTQFFFSTSRVFKNKLFKLTALTAFSLFFILNFTYYLDQYFVQQNYYNSMDWQYGYKELVGYLEPIHRKYKKVVVSNSGEMNQSYIFFLFYLRYDPIKYLANGGTNSGGFSYEGNRFLNFEFRTFNYYNESEKNILLVGSPGDFPEVFKLIHRIDYLNGIPAIHVVEKE